MTAGNRRILIVFHRIGPYHTARLRAAAKGMEIVALQGCSSDRTYAWEKVRPTVEFPTVTLSEDCDIEDLSSQQVRRLFYSKATPCDPAAVAIPGWSGKLAFTALRWCAETGTPAIVMSESTPWDSERTWWKEWVKRQLLQLYSSALVGGAAHRDYLEMLGMDRRHVYLGYDAVDNHYFESEVARVRSRRVETRRQHGLPEAYFLGSARFVEKKNLPRLLQAYALYRQSAASAGGHGFHAGVGAGARCLWDLVLLGDGPLRPSVEAEIVNLGLQGHVHLPGFKQYHELPIYYGLADAFVHSSTTEQWGLVVNEAMASGLPVLVSKRCGCASELVREGVNGCAFDPHNTEELARLMSWLSNGTANLRAMSAESREIIGDWGPEAFATGLEQAVETALSVGSRRGNATWTGRSILKTLLIR